MTASVAVEGGVSGYELLFEEMRRECARRKEPAWMREFREAAFAGFRQTGFPAPRSEDWKYTDLRSVSGGTFSLAPEHAGRQEVALPVVDQNDEYRIVLIDGIYAPAHSFSAPPEGVEVIPFGAAGGNGGREQVQAALTRPWPGDGTVFPLMNAAFMTDGVMLRVRAGVHVARRIHLLLLTTGSYPGVMVSPRIVINVEAGASVRIVQSHIGGPGSIGLTNAVTDIDAGDDSKVFFCKVQSEGQESAHFGYVRTRQGKGSRVDLLDFARGARLARNDVHARVEGEGAELHVNGVYAIRGRQHTDNHTVIDHCVPDGRSRQLYKGILNDAARAVFNGRILVRPGARRTDSWQLNKNLLLSRRASVDTKPQLEIDNDDVKCTHGATVGQLSEEQLFYLQSRGIDRPNAVSILARGFVEDVLFDIEDAGLQSSLRSLLASYFESGGG